MFTDNFEGEYRRKPEQNLVGASRRDGRYELLQKAQEERRRREQIRQHHKHATTVQAAYRSYITRKRAKEALRNEFVVRMKNFREDTIPLNEMKNAMQELKLFFSFHRDFALLKWITNCFLYNHNEVILSYIPRTQWWWYVAQLFKMNLPNLHSIGSLTPEEHQKCFRFFEIYSCPTTLRDLLGEEGFRYHIQKLFMFIVRKGYFKTLIEAMYACELENDSCIPSSCVTSELLPLFCRPWCVFHMSPDNYREIINRHFYAEVLSSTGLRRLVPEYIIPAMSAMTSFSFPYLVKSLTHWSERPTTIEGLYCFLLMDLNFTTVPLCILGDYLQVVADLSEKIIRLSSSQPEDDEFDMNDDDMSADFHGFNSSTFSQGDNNYIEKCTELLDETKRVSSIMNHVEQDLSDAVLLPLANILHHLLMSKKYAICYYKILIIISTHPTIIRELWNCILRQEISRTPFQEQIGIKSMIDAFIENRLLEHETKIMVPLLTSFSAVFKSFLKTLPDETFHRDNGCDPLHMPFSIPEILTMSTKLKNISLTMIDMAFKTGKCFHIHNVASLNPPLPFTMSVWRRLFEEISFLLKHLYIRDVRRQFSPPAHWELPHILISTYFNPNRKYLMGERFDRFKPFQAVDITQPGDSEEGLEYLSVSDTKLLAILRGLPFTISFLERVSILQRLISSEKREHQNPTVHFLHSRSLNVNIRRSHIYEDAFQNLSVENAPEMKIAVRVHFTNQLGMEEVGVDGGGVFREFLSELLKAACDPNRGFFLLTKDNQIYPNPNVALLHPDYINHYYFIGRMLGKAIFENILVELPFADFFLGKILGSNVDVNLNNLASLDPDLYKNLKYLRGFKGNVEDLGLDFSLTVDQYGKTEVIELTPQGTEIGVSSSNRIEYIHLVADFKMNKQIQEQCEAFIQGLRNIIPLEWLSIFNTKELQTIISGQESPIDTYDLEENATYTGGYSTGHPNIQMFWNVVRSFDSKQRSDLLKFVTSCSRPPLLGFKELDPPFCIQYVEGTGDRLPTASTCMNLLKLPIFPNEDTLREKLVYAIESASGFELS